MLGESQNPFDLTTLNRTKLLFKTRWSVEPKTVGLAIMADPETGKPKVKDIPDEVYEIAKRSLDEDHFIRYFCKKYCIPPTDKRIHAYTYEEMIIEYLADAIEEGRIELGVGGKPVKKVMHHGVEIEQTGSAVFDQLEREWAEQDVESLKTPERTAIGKNLLEQLGEED